MQANIVVNLWESTAGMPDPQDLDIQMSLGEKQSVGNRRSHSMPCRFTEVCAKNDGGSGLCCTLASDQQQNRRRIFEDALEAEPDGERDAMDRLLGKMPQIERNGAEAAALEQKIRAAQNLIEIPASHPEQVTHIDACCNSGFRGERIRSIHERADFALLNQCRKDGQSQTGSSRGRRAEDFNDGAAWKAPDGGIECGDPRRDALPHSFLNVGERR